MLQPLPACPVETTLQLIGDKWKILILRDLMDGTKRFGELKKSVGAISQKVLTQNLRSMAVSYTHLDHGGRRRLKHRTQLPSYSHDGGKRCGSCHLCKLCIRLFAASGVGQVVYFHRLRHRKAV